MEPAIAVASGVEHRRVNVSGTDEESAGLVAAARASPQSAQRQLRSVQLMSATAMLLGVASVAMMASVALRSADAPRDGASPTSVVGLSAAPFSAEPALPGGWYRSYVDSQVSADEGLDSAQVDILGVGSLVYVAETRGPRARILKPVQGWISVETADGVAILRPDTTYEASPEEADMGAVLRSRQTRQANSRMQENAMKLTAVQGRLMDAMKKLRGMPSHVEARLSITWPRFAEQGADDLLERVAQNAHVRHAMRGSGLGSLVNKAKAAETSQRSSDGVVYAV